jgi:hypothetical protein
MPRYFFNMVEGEGRDLIRDSDGVMLADPSAARKEAVALARDIVRHGLQGPIETWKIVVTDDRGDQLLILPLSDIPVQSVRTRFGPRSLIARCRYLFGSGPSARFAAVAGLGILIQAALMTGLMIMNESGTYRTASAPASDAVVAVRFVPRTSPEAIGDFLDRYKASVIGTVRPGGFYRLRLAEPRLPEEELTKLLTAMMQESIVEFAAALE